MKTNIRQLQHHLSEVMRYVEHGEEVLITRRNRVVAKIVPAESQIERADWPDFVGRAKAIVKQQRGKPVAPHRDRGSGGENLSAYLNTSRFPRSR